MRLAERATRNRPPPVDSEPPGLTQDHDDGRTKQKQNKKNKQNNIIRGKNERQITTNSEINKIQKRRKNRREKKLLKAKKTKAKNINLDL